MRKLRPTKPRTLSQSVEGHLPRVERVYHPGDAPETKPSYPTAKEDFVQGEEFQAFCCSWLRMVFQISIWQCLNRGQEWVMSEGKRGISERLVPSNSGAPPPISGPRQVLCMHL